MLIFTVEGMSCGHCVKAITQALRAEDPRAEVEVSLESGQVRVRSERDAALLAEAIREAGYEVRATELA
ncbi:MAG TPA: cation transporter [Candidatus Competibacteraceae bacterium]|nr:cation transporter [Candidatus Competibacteraceae bacterium]